LFSKYALLDATFQQCHQVGVPPVIKLSEHLPDYWSRQIGPPDR
jgi:hypothetical protein